MGGSNGRSERSWLRASVAAAAVVVVLAGPARAEEENVWVKAGKGLATGLTNVLYIPAKIVYAGVGGLVGALAYCVTVGDMEVVDSIWGPSLGGSYVLSTDTLFPPPPTDTYAPPPEQPVQEYEPQWPE